MNDISFESGFWTKALVRKTFSLFCKKRVELKGAIPMKNSPGGGCPFYISAACGSGRTGPNREKHNYRDCSRQQRSCSRRAKVSVTDVKINITTSSVTDNTGNYVIPLLNSGTYTAKVELTGSRLLSNPSSLGRCYKSPRRLHHAGRASQRASDGFQRGSAD